MRAPLAVSAVLLVAHYALLRWMAGDDVVATLLSGGSGVPLTTALGVAGFVVVRLLAYLLVPGLVLAVTGAWALDRCARGDQRGPSVASSARAGAAR